MLDDRFLQSISNFVPPELILKLYLAIEMSRHRMQALGNYSGAKLSKAACREGM